jgi:hypothetical protein
VWLNGRDLRHKPLLERKRMLRQLVPKNHPRLMYMSHLDRGGSRFFHFNWCVNRTSKASSASRRPAPILSHGSR